MKKTLLFVLAILMLTFVSVSAQETAVKDTALNFKTVGTLFDWGDKSEDVYNFLSQYEGVKIEVDADNYIIFASGESEEETFLYSFLFTPDENEGLYSIFCDSFLSDEIDPAEIIEVLIDEYGLKDAEPYEDAEIDELFTEYDAYAVVAGPGTIAGIGGSEATEEEPGAIALYFFDRAYHEANK